jgi:hypothetical protein
MPRQTQTQITARPVENAQRGGRQIKAQVFQGPADNLPSYIPKMQDNDAEALLNGLAQFQPKLAEWAKKEEEKSGEQGAVDALAGKEQAQSNGAYLRAYFATDGVVKAQADGSALLAQYETEFDKDKGDLEGWLAENHGTRLKNITDENYISGYNKGIVPALQTIRKAHLDHQRKAVETRVESNAMQLIDNGVRSYVSQGQPIPQGYIEAIQEHVGGNLGVSSQRFNELLFETVRKVGEEGHFDAFDVLKQDRPDGSPGLYFDPAWKAQIDAAEVHSHSAAQARAQKDRDQRQNETLYSVFAEEDPKKAQAMFQDLKKSGLFTRADDLIKWEKLILEKVDGKPDANQLEKETDLLARVYQGGVSNRDLLNAQAQGQITSSQRKFLLSESRRVTHENRTAAAQEGKAADAIYKTQDFRAAEDFLQGMLKPRPKNDIDFSGTGNEFDRAQLAQARLELVKSAQGKSPAEVQQVAEEIVTRYAKRRLAYTADQQERVTLHQVPFESLPEAMEAARKGVLSPDEYHRYSEYFKKETNVR